MICTHTRSPSTWQLCIAVLLEPRAKLKSKLSTMAMAHWWIYSISFSEVSIQLFTAFLIRQSLFPKKKNYMLLHRVIQMHKCWHFFLTITSRFLVFYILTHRLKLTTKKNHKIAFTSYQLRIDENNISHVIVH